MCVSTAMVGCPKAVLRITLAVFLPTPGRASGAFADSCPPPSRPRAVDRSLDDHALFLRVGILPRLERQRRQALCALPALALLPRPAPLEALARGIRPGPVPDCVFTARGEHI